MRIESLEIEGYGVFAGSAIDAVGPGLTLVCGDNGAGKSTLLAFFRAVLFGHETGKAARPYLPLRGGRHGGALTVQMQNGDRFRIGRGPGPPAAGQVKCTPLDASAMPDASPTLRDLLGGAARDLYQNVFAFSLDELQELRQGDAVASRIYSAGAGTGARSVPDARRTLGDEMGDLFLPSGVKPTANQALQSLSRLKAEADRLAGGVEEYQGLQESAQVLAAEIQRDQDSEPARRARLTHVVGLDQAWEHWVSLPALRREIEALPPLPSFPSDAISRLEAHDQHLRGYESRCETLKARINAAETERADLQPDALLLANATAIAELYQGIERWRSDSLEIESLRAEAQSQHKDLEDALRRMGAGWTEQRLEAFDDGVPARAFVDDCMVKLDRCSEEVRLTEDRCGQLEEAAQRSAQDHQTAAGEFHTRWPGEPAANADLDARAAALRKLSRLITTASQAESQQRLLEQQHAAAGAERSRRQAELDAGSGSGGVSPLWVIPALAVAAAGFLYREAAAAAVLTLLAVVSAVLIRVTTRRGDPASRQARAARQADLDAATTALAESQRLLQEQQRAVDANHREIRQSGEATGIQDVSEEAIEQAEQSLAADRQDRQEYSSATTRLQDLESTALAAAREATRAAECLEEKRITAADARETWISWLKTHGLPPDLVPRTVLTLFESLQSARTLRRRFSETTARVQTMERSLQDYHERAMDLARRCGQELDAGRRPDDTVRTMHQALETARDQQRRREALDALLGELRSDYDRDDRQRVIWQDQYDGLLAAGGAENEEAFRSNAALWAQRAGLEARIRELEGRLEVLSGPGSARLALESELAALDRETLSARLQEEQHAMQAFSQSLGDRREQLGNLNNQVQALSTDDRVAGVLQEISYETTRLADTAEEWAIRRAALWLLDRTRERYERERQPAVFQQASRHLGAVTEGAYTQIIKPVEEDAITAATAAGVRKPACTWNRGLKEQVYLCLRLGLIEEYSRHAEPLPIIMDDVLVNCDPGHTRRIAAVIHDFARKFQVIYLTCHTETIDLFREVDSTVPCYQVVDGTIFQVAGTPRREPDPGIRPLVLAAGSH